MAVNSQITIFPFLLSKSLSNVLLYYFARPWQAEPLDHNVSDFGIKSSLARWIKCILLSLRKSLLYCIHSFALAKKADTFLCMVKCH